MRFATALCAVTVLAALTGSAMTAPDVSLDPKELGKPPIHSWPTFNGDYTGQRYSTLTQITPANVNQLAQQWVYKITSVGSPARRPHACDQMHTASGKRRPLHHHSGPLVGARCAHR